MVRARLLLSFLLVLALSLSAGCNNTNTDPDSPNRLAKIPHWQTFERGWQSIVVGESTSADVATAFQAPVDQKDRHAYAIKDEEGTDNSFLMMVDLDEDSIVTAKYSWQWISSAPSPFVRLDTWEIAIDTHIPPADLQEYTANIGPREEAILERFAQRLYAIADHFADMEEVFGPTASMKRIFTLAASQYNMRADKQTLLTEHGFTFDGEIFGDECTMSLKTIDAQSGWYFIVLKGHRVKNFFTGW